MNIAVLNFLESLMASTKHVTLCICILVTVLVIGCNRRPINDSSRKSVGTLPALVVLGAKPGAAIVAQGQLEPATGILPIVAPLGDRVESIEVVEGQKVKVGDALGRLISQAAKELELDIAIARRDEAKAKLNAEEATARAKLEVAKVGLRQSKQTIDQAVNSLEEAESGGGKLALLANNYPSLKQN